MTSFSYDALGRVTQTAFPSSLVETYTYDAVGNLTVKTDRKGQAISYSYDELDRLTSKGYPDSTSVSYTYDAASRLTQVSDPTGTYEFSFDNMGRLTGTTTSYSFLTGRSFTNAYSYDAASNRTSFTDPESGVTAYVYDTLNRLTTLTPPAAISSGAFGFSYDALSRRTQMTRPNSVITSYSYDNLSRLLSVLHKLGATTIDGATYTVDAVGNRTSKLNQQTGVTESYAYDQTYQLTQVLQGAATTESYTYDQVGNRLSSLAIPSYTYNSSNQLTATTTATFTYDNNGNTLAKTVGTDVTTYAWDFENRLVSVTLPGSGGTVTFKYDPFGRRIQKSSVSGTTNYAYDGANIAQEVDSSGIAFARYAQGPGTDEPLAMLRAGATSFYQADGLGSITSLTDIAGAAIATYQYDTFGNATALTGSVINPFRYTAREWDAEIDSYHYRAREYSAVIGRFTSSDPIGFAGGNNFYAYVNNQPLDFDDPAGLAPGKGIPYRWRLCSSGEISQCVQLCGVQGKVFESCAFKQTKRILRLREGPVWADAILGLSCSCKDPNDEGCSRNLKYSAQPTMFEIQQRENSGRYMQRFWGWVLVGDAALAVVGTAGALGLLGGSGAAAGAAGSAPKPIPLPIPSPAPVPRVPLRPAA